MNEIRVAVAGVGHMGSAHAAALLAGQIEGMRLTAVCDISPERLAPWREKLGAQACFSDLHYLLSSGLADAAVIAVPHPLHAELGTLCLDAGLHTLVEKPIDISVRRARGLCDAAKRSGRLFSLMLNQRSDPVFRRAKQIIEQGGVGSLKRTVWIVTNWYRTQHYYDSGDWRATWKGEGGGVLLNQAPHNLDIWQWLCGMPASVTAWCDVAHYHRIEVEDDVTLLTRYANGATGAFLTTTGESPGTNRLEIAGDLGKLVLEEGKVRWWRLRQPEPEVRFASDANFAKIPFDYTEESPDPGPDGHLVVLQNFSDAIRLGTPLMAPGEDGLKELTISNAAYLSQWQGHAAISLPMDEALFDRELQARADASAYPKSAAGKAQTPTGGYSERWQVRW